MVLWSKGTLQGCCIEPDMTQHVEHLVLDGHGFCVTIVYCKNCGTLKTMSHIKEERNGYKTKH